MQPNLMELVHRKIIAGFWPHSNLSPVVGGSPCGGDRPGGVVTPTLNQRQRRRRIVIDEREETRGGGERIVIDEERHRASPPPRSSDPTSSRQFQPIWVNRHHIQPRSYFFCLMGGTQNGIRSRPSSIAAWLDLVVALSCSSLWQGHFEGR